MEDEPNNDDGDGEEVFVATITAEEIEAMQEGEAIPFQFEGDIIERDPVFLIEPDDTVTRS